MGYYSTYIKNQKSDNIMVLYLKMTDECNLDCTHCYNETKCKPVPLYDMISFIDRWNLVYKDTFFVFHGGEPFMRNISDIITLSKHMKTFRVTSNMTIPLSDEHIEFLKTCKVRTTSFDIGIRFGSMTNLNRWIHNMKKLYEMDIPLQMTICLTKHILNVSPEKFVRFMKWLPVATVNFEYITYTGRGINIKDIVPKHVEVDHWLLSLYQYMEKHHITREQFNVLNFYQLASAYYRNFSETRCIECCKRMFTVNPDGIISGCPDTAARVSIGNIYQPMDDIQSAISKYVQSKEVSLPRNECMRCKYFTYCNGGCRSVPFDESGCQFPKETFKYINRDKL